MKINQPNKLGVILIGMEKKLEKSAEKILFPDKLENANRVLKVTRLPRLKKAGQNRNQLPK